MDKSGAAKLRLLNESFSDIQSEEEHEEPYFSGLGNSDDTDDDPDYVLTGTDSDSDELQRIITDTATETIDSVIANFCSDEVSNVDSSTESYNVVCPTPSMKGKNGHLWCNQRTAARNTVHILQGPTNIAKTRTKPAEILSLFFTDEMRNITIEHTNVAISRRQPNYMAQNKTVSLLCKEEFDAFLEILILTVSQMDNHMPTKTLFNTEYCGHRYKATMSRSCFDFLLEALRFDNKDTRIERSNTDRFAPIREIWSLFISSCKTSYKPSSYLTIDEQLLVFRGNDRMYHPTGDFKDWAGSNWIDSLGMSSYFKLRDGVLTVQSSGLYLVYAQIFYADFHDTSGYRLYRNDDIVAQCTTMAHSTTRIMKRNTCFTSILLHLKSSDTLKLREIEGNRYTIFEPTKSFFGLVKLKSA